jgi:putative oxidoreductase
MRIARLILRVLIGVLFIGHGTQKLFGWFGGHGLEGTGQAFESMGLRPGRRNAMAAGAAEAGGGALLIAGAATPFAAAVLIGTMITAIRTVHLKNGPWAADGGYEYNVIVIASLLEIVEDGPGPMSIDGAAGRFTGPGWALLALAAGAVGSELSLRAAHGEIQLPSTNGRGAETAQSAAA